jgi:hypothetical protein
MQYTFDCDKIGGSFMKIVLVGKDNVAIKMNQEGKFVTKTSADTTGSLVELLIQSLENVSDNSALAEEITTIYVSGHIKALVTGTAINYIREGKTGSGTELSAETVALFKKAMQLIGAKNFNVVLKDAQYVSKKDTTTKALVEKAWEVCKKKALAAPAVAAAPQAPAVVANPKIVAKIAEVEEQIMEAIMEDDAELEANLNVKLGKLKAMLETSTGVPATQAPAVEEQADFTPEPASDVNEWDNTEEEEGDEEFEVEEA